MDGRGRWNGSPAHYWRMDRASKLLDIEARIEKAKALGCRRCSETSQCPLGIPQQNCVDGSLRPVRGKGIWEATHHCK